MTNVQSTSCFATKAEFDDWAFALAAEQRYGDGDQRGTSNLIDAAAQQRAAEAVTRATPVSLSRPLVAGESPRGDGLPAFSLDVYYSMIEGHPIGMGSDHIELDCHGHANTHLDALNHAAFNDTWYGDVPVDGKTVPTRGSVEVFAETGIVTRAILVDIPDFRQVDYVTPDRPVTGTEIDAALAAAGVEFLPGDALLLYMGREKFEAAGGVYSADADPVLPGACGDAARWIAEHGVSVMCWDLMDATHPEYPGSPHVLNWAIGLLLVDNADHSRLREVLGAGTQVAGALVVAPLPIEGGTGCNVNPIVLT